MFVKVQYARVNFHDIYFRLYPTSFFPMPLAWEVSGVLVELPTDQAQNAVSNKVFELLSPAFDLVHRQDEIGALKGYMSMPWDPAPLAAASLGQMSTTLTQITEAYNVKDGDTVFIHTTAGGTGLLHTQLRGATVIWTTSTSKKAELAKAHGVDYVTL
ncbi:hypothetical protein BJV78DRAFT_1325888 [Lactifluus subvellereus]|nr:hypothetical protein BJV78DRAFT_1325888 [Lactifluus subvellereus]